MIISLMVCFHNMALGQVADSNAIFLKSKGTWKYPVEFISGIDYYEKRRRKVDEGPDNYDVTFFSDSSRVVNAVFDGEVVLVKQYDEVFMMVVKYAHYFIGYTNLSNSLVKKGAFIKRDQPIAKMGLDFDEKYSVEMRLSTVENGEIDIFPWFRKPTH